MSIIWDGAEPWAFLPVYLGNCEELIQIDKKCAFLKTVKRPWKTRENPVKRPWKTRENCGFQICKKSVVFVFFLHGLEMNFTIWMTCGQGFHGFFMIISRSLAVHVMFTIFVNIASLRSHILASSLAAKPELPAMVRDGLVSTVLQQAQERRDRLFFKYLGLHYLVYCSNAIFWIYIYIYKSQDRLRCIREPPADEQSKAEPKKARLHPSLHWSRLYAVNIYIYICMYIIAILYPLYVLFCIFTPALRWERAHCPEQSSADATGKAGSEEGFWCYN